MNCIQINGSNGIYDSTINNPSVRYGRNAGNNYKNYVQSLNFSMDKFPRIKTGKLLKSSDDKFHKEVAKLNSALDNLDKSTDISLSYEFRYQPKSQKGVVDAMALMGAAYEQLGQKASISVRKATNMLKQSCSEFKKSISAKALDINKDRKIDLSEYASYMIASDILSTEPTSSDLKSTNVTGMITNQGENASYSLFNKEIEEDARNIFKSIQSDFKLTEAQAEFIGESNNLI